jgi:hypothetical protein
VKKWIELLNHQANTLKIEWLFIINNYLFCCYKEIFLWLNINIIIIIMHVYTQINAEAKKMWVYTSTSLYVFMA